MNHGDPLTELKVDMTVRDLGEFDQLLQTLGFWSERQEGDGGDPGGAARRAGLSRDGLRAARPTWTGRGTCRGTQLEVKLGTELDTLIDSLVADAEYSFDEGLAVASSTIKRGTAVLNVSGNDEAAQGGLAHEGERLSCGTTAPR